MFIEARVAELVDAADSKPACRQAGLPSARMCWFVNMISSFVVYYVYAIRSLRCDYIYVGMTNNLGRRLNQHNKGQNRSTKAYKPFILIFSELTESRTQARKREKYLKSGIGKEYLKSLFK